MCSRLGGWDGFEIRIGLWNLFLSLVDQPSYNGGDRYQASHSHIAESLELKACVAALVNKGEMEAETSCQDPLLLFLSSHKACIVDISTLRANQFHVCGFDCLLVVSIFLRGSIA